MYEDLFKESIKKGRLNFNNKKEEMSEIYHILNAAQKDIKEIYNKEVQIKENIEECKISLKTKNFKIIEIYFGETEKEEKYVFTDVSSFEGKYKKYKEREDIVNFLNDCFKSYEFAKEMLK